MALIHTPENNAEPYGDDNPTVVYIAVGQAIHAWEGMESALARLYLALTRTPETLENLALYGAANRKFVNRMNAIRDAAKVYFIHEPDQDKEGHLDALLREVEELSIQRHRVAHGYIVPTGRIELPTTPGHVEIEVVLKYRWGTPFYSIDNLRSHPMWATSWDINAWRDKFMAQHEAINALVDELGSSRGMAVLSK